MRWEDVTCENCGSDEQVLYMESPVPKWYQGKDIRLVSCRRCDLVYACPRPVAEDLYQGYLAGNEKVKEITLRKLNRPNVRKIHGAVVKEAVGYLNRRAATLLDIGCGAGTVMMEAGEMGIAASGIDVNRFACDMLSEMGFEAYCGFTGAMDIAKKYDVITMLDYIEHTYTPCGDLRFARLGSCDGNGTCAGQPRTLVADTSECLWRGGSSSDAGGNDAR